MSFLKEVRTSICLFIAFRGDKCLLLENLKSLKETYNVSDEEYTETVLFVLFSVFIPPIGKFSKSQKVGYEPADKFRMKCTLSRWGILCRPFSVEGVQNACLKYFGSDIHNEFFHIAIETLTKIDSESEKDF